METKVCATCNNKFETWQKHRKYCSMNCFRKAPKIWTQMTLTKEQLEQMYFVEKLSFYKIRDETDIPVNSIRYWFKKWGFKARTQTQAQKGKLNHMYKDGINSNQYRAYLRDKKRCVICSYNRIINIHHIIHRSKGGTNDVDNLITLCPNCHSLVHNKIIKIKSITEWEDTGKKYKKFKPQR